MTKFTFDGENSRTYGVICAFTNSQSGFEFIDIGSKMTVNTVKTEQNDTWSILETVYNEPDPFQIEMFNCDSSAMDIMKINVRCGLLPS